MERGTGAAAKVPGVVVCGKTGTVENSYKGVKQKDHAVFAAFAPRRNPKIAIAVICENAGFGATSSAPIASLMIEQYLNDSIAGPERKAKVEAISKMNLMPPRIYQLIKQQDSIRHAKDASYLQEKGYIKRAKDTIGIEDEDNTETLEKLKANKTTTTSNKDSIPFQNEKKIEKKQTDALLPEKQKNIDTIKNRL
jgi:penicillin-binding protein 2